MPEPARIRAEILPELSNLITALDRRLPQILRPEEAAIAKDAAELRAKAEAMIARLPVEDSDSGP